VYAPPMPPTQQQQQAAGASAARSPVQTYATMRPAAMTSSEHMRRLSGGSGSVSAATVVAVKSVAELGTIARSSGHACWAAATIRLDARHVSDPPRWISDDGGAAACCANGRACDHGHSGPLRPIPSGAENGWRTTRRGQQTNNRWRFKLFWRGARAFQWSAVRP